VDDTTGLQRSPGSGHRTLPHTADTIVEAWAPTRVECIAEVVLGLVDAFAARDPGVQPTGTVPFEVDAPLDEDVVVTLLDDVLYLLDTRGVVPVAVSVEEDEDGAITGELGVVPAGDLELVGAVPKGISRSGLEFGRTDGRWVCRVVVDV
jgi:SHS2 domain-containing protein